MGSSSPATSSAPTIYQLSNIPPPASLTEGTTIDSDLLKTAGIHVYRDRFSVLAHPDMAVLFDSSSLFVL